jgi:hypothetical protein
MAFLSGVHCPYRCHHKSCRNTEGILKKCQPHEVTTIPPVNGTSRGGTPVQVHDSPSSGGSAGAGVANNSFSSLSADGSGSGGSGGGRGSSGATPTDQGKVHVFRQTFALE